MKHNNNRRNRNRNNHRGHNGGGGAPHQGQHRNHNNNGNMPPRNQNYESNGPDVRIRGNAWQVHEKYLALARDAASSGDRIKAESYLQHAEHYFRIIGAYNEQYAQWQAQRDAQRAAYEQEHGITSSEASDHVGDGADDGAHDSGDDDNSSSAEAEVIPTGLAAVAAAPIPAEDSEDMPAPRPVRRRREINAAEPGSGES